MSQNGATREPKHPVESQKLDDVKKRKNALFQELQVGRGKQTEHQELIEQINGNISDLEQLFATRFTEDQNTRYRAACDKIYVDEKLLKEILKPLLKEMDLFSEYMELYFYLYQYRVFLPELEGNIRLLNSIQAVGVDKTSTLRNSRNHHRAEWTTLPATPSPTFLPSRLLTNDSEAPPSPSSSSSSPALNSSESRPGHPLVPELEAAFTKWGLGGKSSSI